MSTFTARGDAKAGRGRDSDSAGEHVGRERGEASDAVSAAGVRTVTASPMRIREALPPDRRVTSLAALQRSIGNYAISRLLDPLAGASAITQTTVQTASPAAAAIQRKVDFTTKTVGDAGRLVDDYREHLWLHTDDRKTQIDVALDPATEGAVLTRQSTGERKQAISVKPKRAFGDYVLGVEATYAGKGPYTVRATQGNSAAATEPFRTVGDPDDEFRTVRDAGADESKGLADARPTLAKTNLLEAHDDLSENMVGPVTLTTVTAPVGAQKFMVKEKVETAGVGAFDDLEDGEEQVQKDWEVYEDGLSDSHRTASRELHPMGDLPDEDGRMVTKQVHRYKLILGPSDDRKDFDQTSGVLPNSGFLITRDLTVDKDKGTATLETVKEGASVTAGGLSSDAGGGRVEHSVTWRRPAAPAE
jgi:hypothetical protein